MISRTRLERNNTGLSLGGLAPGTVKATIKDSFAVGQIDVVLRADPPPGAISELNVENCLVTNNGGTGIFSFQNSGTTTVRVSNTTVTDKALRRRCLSSEGSRARSGSLDESPSRRRLFFAGRRSPDDRGYTRHQHPENFGLRIGVPGALEGQVR